MKVRQIFKEYLDQSFDLWYIGKDCGAGVVVIKIDYHTPLGEGDAHYCDVLFSDGNSRRVFRPDSIDFEVSNENR